MSRTEVEAMASSLGMKGVAEMNKAELIHTHPGHRRQSCVLSV